MKMFQGHTLQQFLRDVDEPEDLKKVRRNIVAYSAVIIGIWLLDLDYGDIRFWAINTEDADPGMLVLIGLAVSLYLWATLLTQMYFHRPNEFLATYRQTKRVLKSQKRKVEKEVKFFDGSSVPARLANDLRTAESAHSDLVAFSERNRAVIMSRYSKAARCSVGHDQWGQSHLISIANTGG